MNLYKKAASLANAEAAFSYFLRTFVLKMDVYPANKYLEITYDNISSNLRRYATIENLVSYIKDLGFPIALSFYLLVRIESKLDRITELLQVLIEKKDKQ
ncbi:hypothetical protein ACS78_16295 [Priestia megaterium]|uniref:YvrJ family protein n=1 Tax=Priestia megaterium TaxID=1404 RepID=UPI00068060D2|nr:hypothetical protein ACS78_16295 [Priestia megaterium]